MVEHGKFDHDSASLLMCHDVGRDHETVYHITACNQVSDSQSVHSFYL